jgi:hypothetical protein
VSQNPAVNWPRLLPISTIDPNKKPSNMPQRFHEPSFAIRVAALSWCLVTEISVKKSRPELSGRALGNLIEAMEIA